MDQDEIEEQTAPEPLPDKTEEPEEDKASSKEDTL